MFEIHARELRATFLRNYSVRNHSVRRHKGISKEPQRKASQRKAPQRKAPHRAPRRRQLKPAKRPGHLARNHATTTRQETASTSPNPGWADVRSSRPAHRRADTTKHAEPNAPVGAKAARSGRVWSPGHTGPACPTTVRLSPTRTLAVGAWINPHRGVRHSPPSAVATGPSGRYRALTGQARAVAATTATPSNGRNATVLAPTTTTSPPGKIPAHHLA